MSEVCYPEPAPIAHPVYLVERSRAECENEPLLESLSVYYGPAANAIEQTRTNLLSGKAPYEQTVLFLVEEVTDIPIAFGSLCLDGEPTEYSFEPLKRIAANPYINVVARDKHMSNRVLLDGETRLGVAMLWGLLELALRDRPGPNGEMPLVYGLVKPSNALALRAFNRVLFMERQLQLQGLETRTTGGLIVPAQATADVVVEREAGHPLPENRDFDAYRPLLGVE
jgi:hypothetical protein